ncbi:MAG: SAM-dependent methyltransferase, partial [Methyloligellaceae bacterium]
MSVHEAARRGGSTSSGKFAQPFAPMVFRVCRAALSRLERGSVRLTLPSGHTAVFRGAAPGADAALIVRNQGVFWKSLRRGGIGFAESYMSGDWTTPDLGAVLRFFLQNRAGLTRKDRTWFRVRLPDRLFHRLRRNTRRGSRRNIAHHYDLGNEFYARWLDVSMMYSSAYFADDGQSLEEGQRAKSDLILDMLGVAPGQTMLEIGSGWGGFAIHAARERDARVHGITLSRSQLAYASG